MNEQQETARILEWFDLLYADLGTHVTVCGGEVMDLSQGSTQEWWEAQDEISF